MSIRRPRSSAVPGRATMADVARVAEVSAITVSRAFSRPETVTEALRTRVLAAAQSLGYVPNRAASALAGAPSMNVVVLIPSMTNLVFVETMAGIHDALHPHGYQMLIGVTRYVPEEEERLLGTYLQFLPDGLLVTGYDHRPATRAMLARIGRPVVHMMELEVGPGDYAVGFSQRAGGVAITRHLLERGYRRIGFVGAQLDPRTLARGEGYRSALTEAGLYAPERELMDPAPSSIGRGAELLDRMLAQAPDCDALFFCNDDLAQGALARCQRRGIAVPGQLAIAGFNDLPASAWMTPALTTVATPRYRIGHEAATMLRQLMQGRTVADPVRDLGFTLMAREST